MKTPLPAFQCRICGNAMPLVPAACPHCGNTDPPYVHTDHWIVNLKVDVPTAEDALERLDQFIRAAHQAGLRALLVIHGYGSSGVGGRIRQAVRNELERNRWADRVDDFVYGEALHNRAQIRDRFPGSPSLRQALEREGVLNNSGCSILLLSRHR